MDADGLPLVGAGIDYTKVGAIHQKRTLAFLNHFIIHTVRFLNRFSNVCEEKLEHLTLRLQRLETTMSILEAKLSSIPGLENITAPAAPASTPAAENLQPQQSSTAEQPSTTSAPEASPAAQAQTEPEPAPAPVEEKPVMTVAKDPRYAKYLKMLAVGVPLAALRPKVAADGLDPDLLETPDAPVPDGVSVNGTGGSTSNNDSDSDFSDEEKEENSDDDDSSSGFSD